MKFMLPLCLLWGLFSSAEALQCHSCRDLPHCNVTASFNCYQQEVCATVALRIHLLGGSSQFITRMCAPPLMCSVGEEPFSVNLGFVRMLGSVQCCDTDNCNSHTVTAPADPPSSGLQCVSCDSSSCSTALQCVGLEDRCLNGSVTDQLITTQIRGCASANICRAVTALSSVFEDYARDSSTDVFGLLRVYRASCCRGDFCNSAVSLASTVSALPLLTLASLAVIM